MPIKLIRSLYNIPPEALGGVVTIGNFDGVHIGHQKLIARIISRAKKLNVSSIVMTFEPHPYEYFSKGQVTIPRLTRMREKVLAIEECGADYVLILPFNHRLANLSASDFIMDVIYHSLRPLEVIIGDDFHFGFQRKGDFSLLKSSGERLGFSVEQVDSVLLEGKRISSTWVRKSLADGNHVLAERLLGHPYSMRGKIRKGDQLGTQWGFPTANIFLHRALTPVKGVYTVYMHGVGDTPLPGVANVGDRPTVDGTRTLLEVHLLNFNQNIYGRDVKVEFCQKLRDEIRYPSVDLLIEQIGKDVVAARDYFSNL